MNYYFLSKTFPFLIFNVVSYGCLAGVVNTIFKKIQGKKGTMPIFKVLKICLYIILACMFIAELFIETSIGENTFFILEIVLLTASALTFIFYKKV